MISVPSMQELLEAGVHFGHQVRRGNPRMSQYLFGVREGVHIVDLEHSERLLKQAAEEAYNLGKEGKILLFVGTKKQAQPIIKEFGEKADSPYIDCRWMGGTLTNFDEIRKNIKKLLELKDKREKGELAHYTKKEQLLIARKLEKFGREYGGVAKLDKLPDALFIIDCVSEKTALLEASRMGIKILAVVDSNANPDLVDYPIPGNDDAVKSIRILLETVANAYIAGKESGNIIDEVKTSQPTKKVATKKSKVKEEKSDQDNQAKGVNEEILPDEVAQIEEVVEKASVKEAERAV